MKRRPGLKATESRSKPLGVSIFKTCFPSRKSQTWKALA